MEETIKAGISHSSGNPPPTDKERTVRILFSVHFYDHPINDNYWHQLKKKEADNDFFKKKSVKARGAEIILGESETSNSSI